MTTCSNPQHLVPDLHLNKLPCDFALIVKRLCAPYNLCIEAPLHMTSDVKEQRDSSVSTVYYAYKNISAVCISNARTQQLCHHITYVPAKDKHNGLQRQHPTCVTKQTSRHEHRQALRGHLAYNCTLQSCGDQMPQAIRAVPQVQAIEGLQQQQSCGCKHWYMP